MTAGVSSALSPLAANRNRLVMNGELGAVEDGRVCVGAIGHALRNDEWRLVAAAHLERAPRAHGERFVEPEGLHADRPFGMSRQVAPPLEELTWRCRGGEGDSGDLDHVLRVGRGADSGVAAHRVRRAPA